MTTPPDWLDTILVPRAVEDDGFTARVTGIVRAERRTRLVLRLVLALVLTAGFAACAAFEHLMMQVAFPLQDTDVSIRAFLDQHGAELRQLVARFDAMPALRRRTGRSAHAVFAGVLSGEQARGCRTEGENTTALVQRKEALSDQTLLRSRCDTRWIEGLAAYDELSTDFGNTVSWSFLGEQARTHLRRAAAAPLVVGAPAPFAVAARDVEALGRLTLGHAAAGAGVFEVLAEEYAHAAAAGVAGDYVAPMDAQDARLLASVWRHVALLTSAAARDDEVAFVAAQRSVVTCAAHNDINGLQTVGTLYLDDARVERLRVLDAAGCRARRALSTSSICKDLPPNMCRVLVALSRLPPLRQQAVCYLERMHFPTEDSTLALPAWRRFVR